MDYIYMDNFRGFEDTVIPLRQVNFLIGENSTGKTSILALLNLINEPRFWFQQDFNCGTYEFGGFTDIVSAGTQDKKEFRIGIFQYPAGKKKAYPYCVLMHFREKEGLPSIHRFTIAENNWAGIIMVNRNLSKYRTDKLKAICKNQQDAECFLRCIVRYSQNTNSGFKKLPPKDQRLLRRDKDMSVFPFILRGFIKDKISEGFSLPPFADSVVELAPIRTKPKGTYEGYAQPFSSEGEHTPHLLRSFLTSKSVAKIFRENLDMFGRESGLFQDIGIKNFGKERLAPFEVNITLGKNHLGINKVGYGVSQVLPVVVELLTRVRGTWFSIQQPEIHLHPKAQAVLGKLLYKVAAIDKKILFVETHSDYLIDRFRHTLANSKNKISTQIMYFEKSNGKNKITAIPILKSGKYPIEQPAGFRNFFINESIRNLEI
jgi:hypothetical protein